MKPPILFGLPADQRLLIEIYQRGQCWKPSATYLPTAFVRSGLIVLAQSGRQTFMLLAPQHPSYDLLLNVLASMSGTRGEPPKLSPTRGSEYRIDTACPLAHRHPLHFRILLQVARAESIRSEALRGLLPDAYPERLRGVVDELIGLGVLESRSGRLHFARNVPPDYKALIRSLGDVLAKRDELLAAPVTQRERPKALQRAADGAPRLFGTDVRLRNLMALAKHGPIYLSDLQRIAGSYVFSAEREQAAPFGRAHLVRTWEGTHGTAYGLDLSFPLAFPLRRLLLKLEQAYPLPALRRVRPHPEPPPPQPWDGDRLALFGGAVATSILFTLGAQDWTFQALCVATAAGHYRNVVEDGFATLLHEGVLEADRPSRPGFDVRIVKIAETFVAKDELRNLLRIATLVWPDTADRVRWAIERLSSRTRKQLLARGFLCAPVRKSKDERIAEKRWRCLAEYCLLASREGRAITNLELRELNPRLARAIKYSWSSFSAFRREVGLPPERQGEALSPSLKLRHDCISEYERLAAEIGYLPNSGYLVKHRNWLLRKIAAQWGGFTQFCDEQHISPARRKRGAHQTVDERREACRSEYRALMKRLGKRPTSADLDAHTSGLYKRIAACWPSFELFCEDIGVKPPRRYAGKAGARSAWQKSLALRRLCIKEYQQVSSQLGHTANSADLMRESRGLLERIYIQWGSFRSFWLDPTVVKMRNDSLKSLTPDDSRMMLHSKVPDLKALRMKDRQ
jgi:hypothetical protein